MKFLASIGFALLPLCSWGAVATNGYVENLVNEHATNTNNPHQVTAAQVGLGNVKDVDTTNADNITSGTLNTERLNVGTSDGTVAAGNDVRFDTISTSRPEGTPPEGSVFVWFE